MMSRSTPGNALNAQDYQNAMMGAAASAERTDLSEVLRPDQVIGSGVLNNSDGKGWLRYSI